MGTRDPARLVARRTGSPTFLLLLSAVAAAATSSACDSTPATPDQCPVIAKGYESPDATSNWNAVRASFGLLEKRAGLGLTDNGNEWQPAFEGGPGTAAELSRPHITLSDGAGNLYIADKEAHGIRKITPDGVITTVAGTNVAGDGGDGPGTATSMALNNPNGLWVRADGTFFILDLGNAKIRKVTPDGTMTTLFVVTPSLPIGRGLWVAEDESEALVAAGQAVKQWTPAQGVRDFATGFGDLGMVLRVGPGRVLIADRAGYRVFEARGDGACMRVVPIAGDGHSGVTTYEARATETPFYEPRAIWPHPGGGLFVGTHQGSQVLFIDTAGLVHLFLDGGGGENSGDGMPYDAPGLKVSELRSLALNPAGDLVITESDEGRVRVVRKVP
jgi:hypothetical protein